MILRESYLQEKIKQELGLIALGLEHSKVSLFCLQKKKALQDMADALFLPFRVSQQCKDKVTNKFLSQGFHWSLLFSLLKQLLNIYFLI